MDQQILTTAWILSISVIHTSVTAPTVPRINSFIADMQTRTAGILDSFRPDRSNIRNQLPYNEAFPEEIELDNRDQVETGSQSPLGGNAVH